MEMQEMQNIVTNACATGRRVVIRQQIAVGGGPRRGVIVALDVPVGDAQRHAAARDRIQRFDARIQGGAGIERFDLRKVDEIEFDDEGNGGST